MKKKEKEEFPTAALENKFTPRHHAARMSSSPLLLHRCAHQLTATTCTPLTRHQSCTPLLTAKREQPPSSPAQVPIWGTCAAPVPR